jgi:hypothetical protein
MVKVDNFENEMNHVRTLVGLLPGFWNITALGT